MLRLFLVVGLATGLMGMLRRPDMDTAMRPRITRRRLSAWGSGLAVGDAVGGGDRFGRRHARRCRRG